MEGGGSGTVTHIYACWLLRLRIPLCTCDFVVGFLVLSGASRSARKKASCARPQWRKLRVWRLAAGRFPPRLFRCVFCGLACSATAGVKNMDFGHVSPAGPQNGLRSEKCLFLVSQALATDPFPRFFQTRPARKLRLTDPKCSSAATQLSPTRLKPPKMAVFVAISPQRVFCGFSTVSP